MTENETMRKHIGALHTYVTGKKPEKDFEKFGDWFPRTWNAIVTNNPTCFDLPSES